MINRIITYGDKMRLLEQLRQCLQIGERSAYLPCYEAIRNDVRARAAQHAVEGKLVDLAVEAFTAGIYAASDADYVPANPEIARIISLARKQISVVNEHENSRPESAMSPDG